MAVIQINNLGGLYPSVSPRALADNAATKANNLLAKTTEFRPLPSDTTVYTMTGTGATTAKTIYRLDRKADGSLNTDDTQGWLRSDLALNVARGAVNDTKGRVYVTDMAGSMEPSAFDAAATTPRHLGVPAPAKPTVSATIVNEYTSEEDALARTSLIKTISDAIITARGSAIAIGTAPANAPSSGVAGWLAHGTSTSPALPTSALGDWAFLSPMVSDGAGGYKMQFPEVADILTDPALFGKQVTYNTNVYWAIPVTMQGRGYTIDQTTLATAARNLANPDPQGTTPWIPVDNANAFALGIANKYLTSATPQVNSIAALTAAQSALGTAAAASISQAVTANTVKAFYSITAVDAEITQAIANFAAAIKSAEDGILTPPDFTGAGN